MTKSDHLRALRLEHPDWSIVKLAAAADLGYRAARRVLNGQPQRRGGLRPSLPARVSALVRAEAAAAGCTTTQLVTAAIEAYAASRKTRAA